MRWTLAFLLCLAGAGCADGDALRNGTRGGPSGAADSAVDGHLLDQGTSDAEASTPDAAQPADAAQPRDATSDIGPNCVPETCNDLDDDCDGSADEGVADCCVPGTRRDCGTDVGQCTFGDQFCTVDQLWSPCSGDPPEPEVCDGLSDEDCDGVVDEQVTNACGQCGLAPEEQCNARDDDCDGLTDEGVLNACGQCGAVPREVCNARDDDCDGLTDEGVLNACGQCGAMPREVCNGVDDDCDDVIDEDVLNACGQCGAAPTETCNGVDDDCDGRVDEAACYAFVLDDADGVWRTPPGLNASPLVTERQLTAAFTTVRGGDMLWATAGDSLYAYDIQRDRWRGDRIRDPFDLRRVDAAYTIPAWWIDGPDTREAAVTVTAGPNFKIFNFDPVLRTFSFIRGGTHADTWAGDRAAPQSFPIEAAVLDLFDNNDYWPGDVEATCGAGRPGPVTGVLTDDRLFTSDSGTCFRFMDQREVGAWAGFRLRSAPNAQNIVAWAYLNRANRTGMHIIILNRPEDGR